MFVFIVLIVVIVVIAFVFLAKSKGIKQEGDLYKSKPLLTANEIEFYTRLTQALPDHHIFPQVALGALLQPNVKGDNRKYYSVRGTFAQKVADYVICNKDIKVVAIVELDDKTHNNDKDAKRDAMLEQAGYKVIRWNSKQKPSIEEIQQKIGLITKTA